MKPDDEINTENSKPFFDLELNKPKDNIYLQKVRCKEGKPCLMLCCSEHCESNAVICPDLKCNCKQDHDQQKSCLMGFLEKIVSKSENKKKTFPDLEKWIIAKYDELIDQISDEKEKIFQRFKSLELSEAQVSFLRSVYGGKSDKLTGKKLHKLVNVLDDKTENQQTARLIQEKSIEKWEQCAKKIKEELEKISEYIIDACNNGVSKIVCDSKVLLKEGQKQIFTQMLESDRKISKLQLLYRASENNFNTDQFWQKCRYKANNVIVAQTEFNKVIGGYTPLSWKVNNGSFSTGYQSDYSLQSFVFSVTEKTKFTLKESQKHHAIYIGKNCGPNFGNGSDFCISNNADSNNNSQANIGCAYENSKVQYNTKQAWQFFQGSTDNYKYKTKEWEVWQVTFQ